MKRLLALAATGSLVAGLAAAPASAVTKHGITPLSPKPGATLTVGQPVTFKLRKVGPGVVFMKICANKKKDKDGVICNGEHMARPSKKGKIYTHTPPAHTFPDWFMVKPGTYYWQAYRIDCSIRTSDCYQEGPIVKFRVG